MTAFPVAHYLRDLNGEMPKGASARLMSGDGESDIEQRLEEATLARPVHRIGQRLVAVAQVDRAPARGTVEHTGRPLAIRQVHARDGGIFPGRVLDHHGGSPPLRRRR